MKKQGLSLSRTDNKPLLLYGAALAPGGCCQGGRSLWLCRNRGDCFFATAVVPAVLRVDLAVVTGSSVSVLKAFIIFTWVA